MWSLPGDTLVKTAGGGVAIGVAASVSTADGVGCDPVAGVGVGAVSDLSGATGAGLDAAVARGPAPGDVGTDRGSERPTVASVGNAIAVGDGCPLVVCDAGAADSTAGASPATAVGCTIRGRSPGCGAVTSLRGSGAGRGLSPQPPRSSTARTSPATAPTRQQLARRPTPASAGVTFRRNGRPRLLCTSQPANPRTVHNPCRERQHR